MTQGKVTYTKNNVYVVNSSSNISLYRLDIMLNSKRYTLDDLTWTQLEELTSLLLDLGLKESFSSLKEEEEIWIMMNWLKS